MSVLTPELLERIRERAAGYDRDNAFFTEDLDELRAAGYLAPRSLLDTARDQRLLAAHAPATALGINMHLVWVGVARVLAERGDTVARLGAAGCGGRRAVRVRQQRAGQRSRAVGLADDGRARGRRVLVHRHQDLHLARAGLDAPRHLRQADRGRGGAAPRARIPRPRDRRTPHSTA